MDKFAATGDDESSGVKLSRVCRGLRRVDRLDELIRAAGSGSQDRIGYIAVFPDFEAACATDGGLRGFKRLQIEGRQCSGLWWGEDS